MDKQKLGTILRKRQPPLSYTDVDSITKEILASEVTAENLRIIIRRHCPPLDRHSTMEEIISEVIELHETEALSPEELTK